MIPYPSWSHSPRNTRPPQWANDLVDAVEGVQPEIDTAPVRAVDDDKLTSNYVLAKLRPGMESLGYVVETGPSKSQKIVRPVRFGENGRPSITYEVDAFHDDHGITLRSKLDEAATATPTIATSSARHCSWTRVFSC